MQEKNKSIVWGVRGDPLILERIDIALKKRKNKKAFKSRNYFILTAIKKLLSELGIR